ncbi:hypothetical protein CHS0354_024742 [Potamilus streckersoni]|uniref:Uncharacterized protein n=1 Tax=Potamilus streckersoni TaxID=2493646 RepID=A0AAE0VKG1_9BIVA|nr:hypothetical protein CHS0354_024742 [Potamilus streckersoni]
MTDLFMQPSSDNDARKAMMRRRIEEVKIHRSASCTSLESFTEPAPAQQAVSAPQLQQPTLQDPFLGTRFPHTIDSEGQGYIGRYPEKPVVGVQDPLMYRQQLSGERGYGDQIKLSDPNKYGSRITQLPEEYDNHVAGARGDEHPSQDKDFGIGSKTFSALDSKDRKSYHPASRLVHKINLIDPRQTIPDGNTENDVSPVHHIRSQIPKENDQGRGPPLRPMYPRTTSDLDASRLPRREPWEGSTSPGQDYLYSGQNEIPCVRRDREKFDKRPN